MSLGQQREPFSQTLRPLEFTLPTVNFSKLRFSNSVADLPFLTLCWGHQIENVLPFWSPHLLKIWLEKRVSHVLYVCEKRCAFSLKYRAHDYEFGNLLSTIEKIFCRSNSRKILIHLKHFCLAWFEVWVLHSLFFESWKLREGHKGFLHTSSTTV